MDLQTIPLIQGTDTYAVDPSTVMIMATYIETGTPAQGRIIISIDRDTYASFPDKITQGQPTVYWYDKLIAPTITVWQPPDANGPYTLKFYRARQVQDASMPGGLHPEVPYRFMEAYTSALAVKLAELYAPKEMPRLIQMAQQSWKDAADRDVENAPLRIVPALAAYNSAVY